MLVFDSLALEGLKQTLEQAYLAIVLGDGGEKERLLDKIRIQMSLLETL